MVILEIRWEQDLFFFWIKRRHKFLMETIVCFSVCLMLLNMPQEKTKEIIKSLEP